MDYVQQENGFEMDDYFIQKYRNS